MASASPVGARLYEGACAVCHAVGGAPLFGSRPSLALNSNLHSAMPDNLIQVILHGIAKPASSDLGYMPGFKDSMSDGQLAELVSYLRAAICPGKTALERRAGGGRPDQARDFALTCHARVISRPAFPHPERPLGRVSKDGREWYLRIASRCSR